MEDKKTKFTKEQIINQGIQFHVQGNLYEAVKYYEHCIKENYNNHLVFSNYGLILKDIGKLNDAEIYTKKAIEIKPDFAEAYSNLGIILKDKGDLKEAEFFSKKAIKLKPQSPNSYSNLGTILLDLGNVKQSEKYIRKAIEIKPEFAEAHFNLGNTLREKGDFKNAELSYLQAINIKPKYADAYVNLAFIFLSIGKLKEAEEVTRKAILIKPDFAEAYSNLGNLLMEIRELDEAEEVIKKAIELNPDFPDSYINLANVYKEKGRNNDAFNFYCEALKLNSDESKFYNFISEFLSTHNLDSINKIQLKDILKKLLKREDIDHKYLFFALNILFKKDVEKFLKFNKLHLLDNSEFISFLNDEILISALKKMTFKDIYFEKLLTILRNLFCNLVLVKNKAIKDYELNFVIALANQCFLNDYVYSTTLKEEKMIDLILKKIINKKTNEFDVAVLGCYKPLYQLIEEAPIIKTLNSYNSEFNKLINTQIKEPLKEIELAKGINKIGTFSDNISLKVKSLYENNPYPQWKYSNPYEESKISILRAISSDIKPNHLPSNLNSNLTKVLIAGCGTGLHLLHAQKYKNAKITGIDLSLSSLAYAKRKLEEYKINNVELINLDILKISLLKKKYDLIECIGVLHHMHDPIKGLKSLLKASKKNTFIKLALYSKIGNEDVIKACNFLENKQLEFNKNNMAIFRKDSISGKFPEIADAKERGDFYSTSEARDLYFHYQAHRFDLNELKKILDAHKLEFLGFVLPQSVKSKYLKIFNNDKCLTNLNNWAKFELQNPKTFKGMYQFWVIKK